MNFFLKKKKKDALLESEKKRQPVVDVAKWQVLSNNEGSLEPHVGKDIIVIKVKGLFMALLYFSLIYI